MSSNVRFDADGGRARCQGTFTANAGRLLAACLIAGIAGCGGGGGGGNDVAGGQDTGDNGGGSGSGGSGGSGGSDDGGGGSGASTPAAGPIPGNVVVSGGSEYFEPMNVAVGESVSVGTNYGGVPGYLFFANALGEEALESLEYKFTSTASASAEKFYGDLCTYTSGANCGTWSDPERQELGVRIEHALTNYMQDTGDTDTLSLTLRDGGGIRSTTELYEIEIEPLPPIVGLISSADNDGRVSMGSSVAINAYESYDPQGGYVVDTSWSLVDSPATSTAVLTSENPLMVRLTPDATGEYRVEATLTDNQGMSSTGEHTIIAADEDVPVPSPLVEVHSPTIDAAVAGESYSQYPFRMQPSNPVTIHEKVGRTVTLEAGAGTDASYEYRFVERPGNSSAVLECPDGTACGDAMSQPTRQLTPDRRGRYVVEMRRIQGTEESRPATVTVIATAEGENAVPMSPDGIVYEHTDACIVSELSAAWSGDADGNLIGYNWFLAHAPDGAEYGFVSSPETSYEATRVDVNYTYLTPDPDETLRSVYFRTDTPGEYVVELIAEDKRSYSERVKFPFTVESGDEAPSDCFVSSDADTVNDYYDANTTDDGSSNAVTGSAGHEDSCTGACVSFQVNRAIYGF